ncbi:uncharacterized protein RCC_09883 [Ramularia collo-cygni]|uniref:Uncharacterized protein n=1 Tax=Ramularia collo-cygni TaxID=112498 RepID=A0A2D3V457_9PEZI|nr:uncharacterized protein RCC_09883 [Ramularia collo-cygni]CZT24166.1 uncharacterized protein RCC_09883 [Ramularia collo-cygni]
MASIKVVPTVAATIVGSHGPSSTDLTTTEFTKLQYHIQGLAAELRDMILEKTLMAALPSEHELILATIEDVTSAPGKGPLQLRAIPSSTEQSFVYISPLQYIPPLGLQINRQTRARFAKKYYGNTPFFVCDDETFPMLHNCFKWLKSLTQEHRDLIQTIKCAGFWTNRWYSGLSTRVAPPLGRIQWTANWLRTKGVQEVFELWERERDGKKRVCPGADKFVLLLEHQRIVDVVAEEAVPIPESYCSWSRGDGTFYRDQEQTG